MGHTRSVAARAANAAPDTMTRDLFIITLPDALDPITFYFATADVTVSGQFYEGKIRSTPALGYSDGGNQDGGDFTIENFSNTYGPTFMNTDRRLDGAEVVVKRAWKLEDRTWEDTDPGTGLAYEIMRGPMRTQPIDDENVACNIVSDTSDPTVTIGGDPIFQHCDKFYNKNFNHPLGGPCGQSAAMLMFQFETATVEDAITGSGNARVIVAAAGMTGSPKTVDFAVVALDSSTVVATKMRAALTADANVSAWFNVGGEGEDVQLSTKTKAAHDATMNINFNNLTCTGLTPTPVSEHTSRIFCDKTLDGPQGCKAKGNFRHGGVPGLTTAGAPASPDTPGGLDDPYGGYGPGSEFHRPLKLDPDLRFPFPQ